MDLVNMIGVLGGFGWLVIFGLIAFAVVRSGRGTPPKGIVPAIVIVAIISLALNVLSVGLVFVEPTDRGVVVSAMPGQQGVRQEVLQPGLNWIVPYFDRVVYYTISRQTYTMSIAPLEGQIQGDDSVEARTSDGQIVFVDATVIYAIDPVKAVNLHIRWESGYEIGLVRPLSRGIIRDAVSTFGIEEVYSTERLTLNNDITAELAARLDEEGLILIDFVLRNIAFSPEYAASVEQKQVAEQQAQQSFFVVEQRRQEAEQARQSAQGQADAQVIRAEGEAQSILIYAQAQADARLLEATAEAEALRTLGDALADNPDILLLQYIEKIGPNIRVMLLPNDNPFLLPLPDLETIPETVQP